MKNFTTMVRQCLFVTMAATAFQAHASGDAVIRNFVVIEAASLTPVQFCMPGFAPVWRQQVCSTPDGGRDAPVYSSVSPEEYLQAICPGAILRSLSPTPNYKAQNSVAIGYEPPLGGCKPTHNVLGQ